MREVKLGKAVLHDEYDMTTMTCGTPVSGNDTLYCRIILPLLATTHL